MIKRAHIVALAIICFTTEQRLQASHIRSRESRTLKAQLKELKLVGDCGIDAPNNYDWTAIMLAAYKGKIAEIVSFLNEGADIYTTTISKDSFHSVLAKKHPELLENVHIKEALENYEARRMLYSKKLAQNIIPTIHAGNFPTVLAHVIAEYATDHAPHFSGEPKEEKSDIELTPLLS